jgi:predicted small metal-binding protein
VTTEKDWGCGLKYTISSKMLNKIKRIINEKYADLADSTREQMLINTEHHVKQETKELKELYLSEDFIDDIVQRIRNKQLIK